MDRGSALMDPSYERARLPLAGRPHPVGFKPTCVRRLGRLPTTGHACLQGPGMRCMSLPHACNLRGVQHPGKSRQVPAAPGIREAPKCMQLLTAYKPATKVLVYRIAIRSREQAWPSVKPNQTKPGKVDCTIRCSDVRWIGPHVPHHQLQARLADPGFVPLLLPFAFPVSVIRQVRHQADSDHCHSPYRASSGGVRQTDFRVSKRQAQRYHKRGFQSGKHCAVIQCCTVRFVPPPLPRPSQPCGGTVRYGMVANAVPHTAVSWDALLAACHPARHFH
eukprot:364108-Chlamydomonas_euryale.AAC.3